MTERQRFERQRVAMGLRPRTLDSAWFWLWYWSPLARLSYWLERKRYGL